MDVRKLDLNLLVTLEALLAERNVTRAAERIGLSQPAVSAQLARLRDIFEDQLLVPAQRGMTPTAYAIELQAPLRHALDQVRDVVTKSGDDFSPETAAMTIAIAATDIVQAGVCLPITLALRQDAPNMRFALRPLAWELVDKELENGTLDCAIIIPAAATPTMRVRPLHETTWHLIARVEHPVVRGSISLDQFCALDHVLTEPSRATFEGVTDTALKALGRERRVVLSVADFLVAMQAVARSDLIAVIPTSALRIKPTDLQFLEPPLKMPASKLVLAWHERVHAHPGHRWFRNAFVERFQMF
jgi:DNA-binding transcriptional LysR family regulator